MIEILTNMCELEGVAKVDTTMDCDLSHCPHRRQLSTELPRCSQYWMSTRMVRKMGGDLVVFYWITSQESWTKTNLWQVVWGVYGAVGCGVWYWWVWCGVWCLGQVVWGVYVSVLSHNRPVHSSTWCLVLFHQAHSYLSIKISQEWTICTVRVFREKVFSTRKRQTVSGQLHDWTVSIIRLPYSTLLYPTPFLGTSPWQSCWMESAVKHSVCIFTENIQIFIP